MTYSYDHRSAASMPSDYTQAKERRDELEAEVSQIGKKLKALSGGGAFNLTPDSTQDTPEWQKAKREYDDAFAALQRFNAVFVRRFRKEIRQDRRRH
jgi:hypothetical protein